MPSARTTMRITGESADRPSLPKLPVWASPGFQRTRRTLVPFPISAASDQRRRHVISAISAIRNQRNQHSHSVPR